MMKTAINNWLDSISVDSLAMLRDAVIDRLREDGLTIYSDPTDLSPEQRTAILAVIDGTDLATALADSNGYSFATACRTLNPTDDEVRELAQRRGIPDAGLPDHPVVRLAAELAFTRDFGDWFRLIAELQEAFKHEGATSSRTVPLLIQECQE